MTNDEIKIPYSVERGSYQTASLILTIWAAKQWFHAGDPEQWNRCFDSLSDILEIIESFMDEDFLGEAGKYKTEEELINNWKKYFIRVNQ